MLGDKYLESADTALAGLLESLPAVRNAADIIVEAVTAGRSVFVTDTFGILEGDLVGEASGLALFRSLQEAIHEPADGDVLVLGAYEPAGAQDLEMLSQALDRGLTVIAIAPPGQLTDRAHAHIPHIADQQNGILTTPGIGRPFCPVSGIVVSALGWMLAAEIAGALRSRNLTPTVWWDGHMKGGDDKQLEARRRLVAEGY